MFLGNGIPIIRISNLPQNASFVDLDDCIYYKKGNYISFEVHNGDFLIAMSGATTGKTAIYNKKTLAYLNQRVGLFKSTNSDSLYYPFLYAFVSTPVFKRQLSTRLIAGAQPNISSSDIESIRISIPQKNEQEKIAHLMLLLDERIATQNKIIEKLESLIKGIAHKVAGMGEPNIRIAECLECTSSTLQESEVSDLGTYPVYGANGIVGYLDSYNTSDEAIYIVKDGSGVGSVIYVKGRCSATGTLNILTAKQDYSLQFLYYLLREFNYDPYKTGMAIPHIYFKDYGKAKIFCPPYAGQLRYAQMLDAIDTKLLTEQKSLVSLNCQKQYLLRQMFI